MMHQAPARRAGLALAGAALVAVAAAQGAAAKPFDTPPSPVLCASGVAVPQTFVQGGANSLPPGSVTYVINEQGGSGAMVAWVNLDSIETGQLRFGTAPLEPTPIGDEATAPIALVETGEGTVLSAMAGVYENAQGETCILLPGFTSDDVPGAPASD
ncbi:hypothetical protein HT102_15345 [Hoyosella sp. G463]|uniref:Uncharacterized protein n=1 Tax=Lolliginicoccus lacisalsi TaxID=2742202 RepID=A0A927JEG5_9ACTN|nr:hypothetical protein [Lolliginicoccus lacisalsi]MBD8507863.1 hypothetical protein [Lolliginicoccus lacisalsi]